MKLNKKKEIKNKTLEELQLILVTSEKELSQLRLDKSQQKLKNTRSIFMKRQEIAFIQTIQAEKRVRE